MPVLPSTLSRRAFLSAMAGAGEAVFRPPRMINPENVVVPCGYRVDAIATGLTYPTAVITDDADRVYVVESGYSYGEDFTPPRLLRLEPNGTLSTVATGEFNDPWTGDCFHNGAFYLAEGGELQGGRTALPAPF